MLHFDKSHYIVTRGSRVSCAPSHHTLPAFLNLSGSIWGQPDHVTDFFSNLLKICKNV